MDLVHLNYAAESLAVTINNWTLFTAKQILLKFLDTSNAYMLFVFLFDVSLFYFCYLSCFNPVAKCIPASLMHQCLNTFVQLKP